MHVKIVSSYVLAEGIEAIAKVKGRDCIYEVPVHPSMISSGKWIPIVQVVGSEGEYLLVEFTQESVQLVRRGWVHNSLVTP